MAPPNCCSYLFYAYNQCYLSNFQTCKIYFISIEHKCPVISVFEYFCVFLFRWFTSQSTALVMRDGQFWTSPNHTFFLGKLPVIRAHTFACNWQQPFFNKSAEGRRMTLEINSWSILQQYGTGPGSNMWPLDLQSDANLYSKKLPTALFCDMMMEKRNLIQLNFILFID